MSQELTVVIIDPLVNKAALSRGASLRDIKSAPRATNSSQAKFASAGRRSLRVARRHCGAYAGPKERLLSSR
jgi:hypothetical protein